MDWTDRMGCALASKAHTSYRQMMQPKERAGKRDPFDKGIELAFPDWRSIQLTSRSQAMEAGKEAGNPMLRIVTSPFIDGLAAALPTDWTAASPALVNVRY